MTAVQRKGFPLAGIPLISLREVTLTTRYGLRTGRFPVKFPLLVTSAARKLKGIPGMTNDGIENLTKPHAGSLTKPEIGILIPVTTISNHSALVTVREHARGIEFLESIKKGSISNATLSAISDGNQPFGSMPRFANSLRSIRFIHVASDESPSLRISSSSWRRKSSLKRIWYCGDFFKSCIDTCNYPNYYLSVTTRVVTFFRKSNAPAVFEHSGASNQTVNRGNSYGCQSAYPNSR